MDKTRSPPGPTCFSVTPWLWITLTDRDDDNAQACVESEFEKCRIVQDPLFESDFDRAIQKLPPKGDHPQWTDSRGSLWRKK